MFAFLLPYSLRPHPIRPVYSKFFCAEKIKPLATKSAVRDCMNYKVSGQHSTTRTAVRQLVNRSNATGAAAIYWVTAAPSQGQLQSIG